jgi:hypothetical protein
MKHWVFTFRVEPPAHVISARDGSSVFFAAYSTALRRWFMVYPGGEEMIGEPEMLFLEEQYVREHPSKVFVRPENISSCRKNKDAQLLLF